MKNLLTGKLFRRPFALKNKKAPLVKRFRAHFRVPFLINSGVRSRTVLGMGIEPTRAFLPKGF